MSDQDTNADALDLFCLSCGYNLRGQSGDPRRCPECGHENRMIDLQVPAKQIRKALRRLESGAAMCGVSAATSLLWVGPLLVVMFNPQSTPPPLGAWVFVGGLGAGSVAGFALGLVHFRQSCASNPRWLSAILSFSAVACLIAAAGMTAIVAGIWSLTIVSATWPVVFTVDFFLRVGGAAALLVPIPWLYRAAKRSIHPLQRETAAKYAREHLSKKE